jgi:hypothetical protein
VSGGALVSCSYSGFVNHRLLNLPPENAAHAAGKTVNGRKTS